MAPEDSTDKYVVEIRDEIGYTKDAFDFVELPEGLRALIAATPDKDAWSYTDEDGATYEAVRA